MSRAAGWIQRNRLHALALLACGVVGLATVVAPWYALGDYVPNGWDATWWARGALLAAVLAIVALRLCRDREAAVLAALALLCVAVRAIVPPDFGFGFDGLDVPVERRFGLWIALAAALIALAATAALAARARRRRPVEPETVILAESQH